MFKLDETIAKKVLETIEPGLVSGLGVQEPGKMCVEAAVCYALGLPHGDDPGCVSSPVRYFKIRINDSNWSSPQARAKGLRRLAIAQLGTKDTIDNIKFVTELAKLAEKWAKAVKTTTIAAETTARYAADAAETTARAAARAADAADDADAAARAAADAADAAYVAEAADAAYVAEAADAAAYAADAADAAYVAEAAYAAAYAAAYVADAADAAAYVAYAAAYVADAADAGYVAAYAAADAAARAARDKVLSDVCEDVVNLLISMNAPGTKYLYLTEK